MREGGREQGARRGRDVGEFEQGGEALRRRAAGIETSRVPKRRVRRNTPRDPAQPRAPPRTPTQRGRCASLYPAGLRMRNGRAQRSYVTVIRVYVIRMSCSTRQPPMYGPSVCVCRRTAPVNPNRSVPVA